MHFFRLHEYIDRRHKKLGPIFYEKLGGNSKLVFISDPVIMKSLFLNLEGKYPMHLLPDPWILYEKLYGYKRGLFFMNGEEWLKNRRVLNKHLLKEDVEKWITVPVQDTVSKFIKGWQKEAGSKYFVPDLETTSYRFSTDGEHLLKYLFNQNIPRLETQLLITCFNACFLLLQLLYQFY